MNSLVLVGYRGSGKSCLGRLLARDLGLQFVDLDGVIEQRSGRSIQELFPAIGEADFRAMESDCLAEVMEQQGVVVASGGGAVLAAENRRRIQRADRVIYLQVEVDELIRRLQSGARRPPLTSLSFEQEVRQLVEVRDPLYREVADVVLAVLSGEDETGTLSRLRTALGLDGEGER